MLASATAAAAVKGTVAMHQNDMVVDMQYLDKVLDVTVVVHPMIQNVQL